MASDRDPTTERILRDGDDLLDRSHELLRDLDEQLRRADAPDDEDAGDGSG